MNYDVYKSIDTLETAISLDNTHFFAQMKYAELMYRLRALECAETETLKAVDLACNGVGVVDRENTTEGHPSEAAGRNSKAGLEQAPQDTRHRPAGIDDTSERPSGDLEMRWKYFGGASVVVVAAFLKAGVPLIAVIGGVGLAALLNFLRHRLNSARIGSSMAKTR